MSWWEGAWMFWSAPVPAVFNLDTGRKVLEWRDCVAEAAVADSGSQKSSMDSSFSHPLAKATQFLVFPSE